MHESTARRIDYWVGIGRVVCSLVFLPLFESGGVEGFFDV
jgi:hypothetical protein